MKFFNLIIIVLILNYGCYKKQGSIKLDKISDVTLEVSQKEALTFLQYLVVDGDDYLTTLDTSINAINFYNIYTKKIKSSIHLNKIYNAIIPGNNDILAINLDSLIVINTLLNRVTLVDKSGDRLNEWNIKNYSDYSILSISPGSRVIYKDYKFFLPTARKNILIDDHLSLSKYYESTTNVILDIHPNGSKEIKFFGRFPTTYKKESKNFYNFFPSFTIDNENNIILSFNKDHKIMVYNNEGKLINEKIIKSRYIDEFKDIKFNEIRNFSSLKKYILSEPSYEKIVFDPFYDMYYRVVRHPIKNIMKEDGSLKTIFDSNFSIIFLDKELNILDEIIFNSKEYYFPGLFPTRQGIMIPSICKSNSSAFCADIFKVITK